MASEGIVARLGGEEFRYTAGSCDWLVWQFSQGGWDAEVTDISPETFIFAVQGPASLFILEKAAGESLRDLGFNRTRGARVGGLPVRVLRTGISGELGYELHGPADDADAVWRLVTAAGQEFGLRHLGFRSQPGRTVSPTLRAMISLCVIGRDHAAPGTGVTVVWGRPGTPQREIRATVTALPFKPDRRVPMSPRC